ncbi:rust resistance kinase Lr10-like [Magnolia sinica]|uniref:rust resistance kinase Lr10-like n=1 Tax=Magnolia sinica TaxID=86752 RepID=UPI00265A93E7|nr:rust resistance kinase Lr10-like [Magnolia sinica]
MAKPLSLSLKHTMIKKVLAFVFIIFSIACNAKKEDCYPSSCGVIPNISYPFYLNSDPAHFSNCGYINLFCEDNRTVLFNLSVKYYVEEISYINQEIRVVHAGLQRNSCFPLPQNSYMQTFGYSYQWDPATPMEDVIFVNCSQSIDDPSYITALPCLNKSTSSFLYVLVGQRSVSDLEFSCEKVAASLAAGENLGNKSYLEIHRILLMGLRLRWYEYHYRGVERCPRFTTSPYCFFEGVLFFIQGHFRYDWIPVIERIMIPRTSIGIFCLAIYLIYKLRRRHLSMDETIEAFLSNYKTHIPKRYSYWGILMMTNRFKEKLGQGGFGSVYKGKLPNGHLVAVKMLAKSKGDGQDFINEVATIGRIHHVNIVQLIGFCAEGSKRALIYDFMPNGSLDKHIFSQEGTASPLSWEKLHEIALGIARGIEYLHRGCDMQILHFDIKPHNILLDKDFIPKVSDFGLAKFFPTDDSIVSVTAARGTIGYMAPELFYHNIGGVSYKSDVYSFGMLLMEIAGRRKNLNAFADKSSQIYFPSWIYDRLEQGGNVELEDATEDEKILAKKFIIIALWCIQMKPTDRPSMSKVVEMLEGSAELPQMPPKPFLSSPQRVPKEDDEATTSA